MGGVTYISPAKRNESGNVLAKPQGEMKAWTCALCPETGEAASLEGRRRALDAHFLRAHAGKD